MSFPRLMSTVPAAILASALLPTPGAAQCLDELTASDAIGGYGTAVDATTDLLVVGAPNWGVYVLAPVGDAWVEHAKLLSEVSGDYFGRAVAVDGERVIVGAPQSDGPGENVGAAFVFEELAGVWTETAKLTAPSGQTNDRFGTTVAISGEVLAVGAPGAGTVYIHESRGIGWVLTDSITPFDKPNEFGTAVHLDGFRLVVGAPGHGGVAGGADAAGVYVYEKGGAGWQQQAKLVPSSGAPKSVLGFGSSVAIDGDVIAVGSETSIYIFEHILFGWAQSASLQPFAFSGSQGWSVDVSNEVLAAGNADLDIATTYRKVDGAWTLEAIEGDHPFTHDFGADVAVSDTVFAAGSPDGAVGTVFVGNLTALLDNDMAGCPLSLSVTSGGLQSLTIRPGEAASNQWFFVLGSMSGTTPGFDLGSVHIPLNLDAYFDFTLANANNPPPLVNTLGMLDKFGMGNANIDWPAWFATSLAGTTLHHASVVFDLATLEIAMASNAVPLELTP